MKLSDIFPTSEQLKLIRGVESELLRRKQWGKISGIAAVAGAIFQLLIIVVEKLGGQTPATNIIVFFKNLYLLKWDQLAKSEFTGIIGIMVLFVGSGSYLLFRWTNLLLKESRKPFQYTFFVEPFKHVKDTKDDMFKIEADDRFHYLLHHDLMERLNDRIQRLSLLETDKLSDDAKRNLSSHIHIRGHYTVRKTEVNKWVIHVMPLIRIGSTDNPETLANPIKYELGNYKIDSCRIELVDTGEYNQIAERIYSSVATEIYRQIKTDLEEKIKLFPTKYLRAVALYYEAEDFAKSNTIDAYDLAIELYKESLRYFDSDNVKPITNFLLKVPLLWRKEVKFQHMLAKVKIGYAKCLIYRREISALSGRYKNPLFEIRSILDGVIKGLKWLHNRINLFTKWKLVLSDEDEKSKKQNRLSLSMVYLTYPKDSWKRRILLRPAQSLFERQKRLFFDAYVIAALTHYYLGAIQKANEHLGNAKAIDPAQSEKNALYLFASGEIEPDTDKAIFLLRQTTEIEPDFQIAQYRLAYYSEMKFRMQNEIVMERGKSVIKEYERVLEINPGNIASLAAQGYLLWLLNDLKKAEKQFKEGCEVKAIARETFIGQLNYGLARIAAEKGKFNESYDRYNEAISSDPGVGIYSATTDRLSIAPYYDYIHSKILERFDSFKKRVENNLMNNKSSQRTIDVVHSFVLNDYGNACLNYFHRFGDMEKLEEAIKTFDEAIKKYPQNKIPYFNLQNAYSWRRAEGDMEKGIDCLKKIQKLGGPTWPPAVITLVQSSLRQRQEETKKMIEGVFAEIKAMKDAEDNLRKEIGSRRAGAEAQTGTPPDKTKIDKLQKEVQEHKEKATKMYNDVEIKLKGIKEVLKEVERNIKLTKLKSIYEGFEFGIDGKGVDRLLNKKEKIGKDRLDEYDIDALRVWAEVLSNNFTDDKATSAAEKLCGYIQDEYYPENFDVNLILYNMNLRQKDVDTIKSDLVLQD